MTYDRIIIKSRGLTLRDPEAVGEDTRDGRDLRDPATVFLALDLDRQCLGNRHGRLFDPSSGNDGSAATDAPPK
jgi:hypothetical protein